MNFGPVVVIAFLAYLLVSDQGAKLWGLATTPAPGWPGLFSSMKSGMDSVASGLTSSATASTPAGTIAANASALVPAVGLLP